MCVEFEGLPFPQTIFHCWTDKLRLVTQKTKTTLEEEEAASTGRRPPAAPPLPKSRGRTPRPELPKFKQFHGRNFVAEARAQQYKTITMPCANGNNCPRGGTFKFSPEDQAFNEASFATGGTQEPKRCACASACVPVSGRCLLDMKYPSTLSPKPEP